jgi:hypothetical protein
MGISMSTALSGGGRVDDIQGQAQGEIRGETKLVNITEDVRKFAAEQGVSEQEALQKGMEEKSREFVYKCSELYAKA